MTKIAKAFLLLAVVLAAGGCRKREPLTPQQLEGKRFYQGRCAHCHQDNDLAMNPAPPNLHRVFSGGKLPSGAPASDAVVRQEILAGKGMMPSFSGRFTDDEMGALLAYLHTGLR